MIGRSAPFVLLASLLTPLGLTAQIARDSARLAEIVVTARRDSAPARLRAAAADVLSGEELRRRGAFRLAEALRLLPGAAIVSTGAPGGVTSAFVRGTNSNQTLLLIDGVRVNDANTSPTVLLGGFDLDPTDRLEVVRGPQGTLYGGAAVGGVMAVGSDWSSTSKVAAGSEAGSFGTVRGRFAAAAHTNRVDVRGAASVVDTDNERRFNQYGQRTQSVQLRFRSTTRLTTGLSVRALQSSYSSPGDLRTTNTTPVGKTEFDHILATGFIDARVTRTWSSRLIVGRQHYFTRGTGQFDGGPISVSRLRARRWIADWQHRVAVGSKVVAVGGLNAEWSDVADDEGSRDERLKAGYLDVTLTPSRSLNLTGGLRRDDYTSFGGRTTGRLAASYFIDRLGLKVRSSVGTGFLPPYLAARFGGPFQNPNPTIRAERSTGWDFGVDHFFAANQAVVSLTGFRNDLKDLIGFESAPFPALGRAINIGRARTWGMEASARIAVGRVDGRVGYTYLRAEDRDPPTEAERRLIRRPRHLASADLLWSAGKLTTGLGFNAAFDREDSDFNTFPFRRIDPGTIFDARVSADWRVGRSWLIRSRIENVFNERYEEVYGYPALGRRVIVGLSFER